MTRYVVYDVFTDRPFGGNPLAVFPNADALADEVLQPIAREFNFSETVFVFEDAEATARLRIFTPLQEIPFAGHPLIGTAVALADDGADPDMRFRLADGTITARAEHGSASFFRDTPLNICCEIDPATVTACLGLPAARVAGAVMASVGLPFVLAELRSAGDLDAITTDIAAFRRGHETYPSEFDFAILAYHRRGDAIDARMFAPLDDIPEDPATGSAAAALGAYLRRTDGRDLDLVVTQGVAMNRPSRISVSARAAGVTICGRAIRVMEGRLTI